MDGAVAAVLVIVAFELARLGRDRLAHLADQLDRALVEADHRPVGIGRFGIEVEHVFHAGDIFTIDLWNAPHILAPGLRPFSASRRRTVSPDRLSWSVSLTIAPAKSSSVQRARPSGGVAQAVATSRASSLHVSLRS